MPKIYLAAISFAVVLSVGGYIKYLKSDLEDKEIELKTTSTKLEEANKNNTLIIEAYEKTLAIEREIAKEKAVTSEQKEIVVTKYKTLTKTVEKRGEIKADEKSNFTIINF